MPTNPYFRNTGHRAEQNLYEDLIIESIKMFGQDFYYIPREVTHEDRLLGEDIQSVFDQSYVIEMYVENVESFGGAGDIFQKIGLEIRDETTLVVSKRRWRDTIKSGGPDKALNRPREGDLVFYPLSNHLFEIMHVEHEEPMYALGNLPTYKLNVALFERNNEDIDVDIAGLDINDGTETFVSVEAKGYMVKLVTASAGAYLIGETVSQTLSSGTIVVGEVVKVDDTSVWIGHMSNDSGKYAIFGTGTNLVGARSGVSLDVTAVVETLDPAARNDDFEDYADTIIDFDETNPFGAT